MRGSLRICKFYLLLSLSSVLGSSTVWAQPGPVGEDWLQSMEWRLIGPHRAGRVVAVAGHPTELMTFYFGATGGGVWRTTDGGWTWGNLSDGFFETGSVGAIAVSPSQTDVIYVGMGEGCLRGNLSPGDGVYKSTDGGESWEHLGLADTQHIGRVRIHPENPDIVYVAALGHAFGPSPERGVFRSQDGGKSWEKVLFRSEKAGAIDLSMDPQDPDTLYAALWEVRRYPWGFRNGGPDSSLYKTTDGGDTWVEITNNPGLPKGVKTRMGITAAVKKDRVWSIVESAEEKGVYLSEDGGATWHRVNDRADLLSRSWYYYHIYADTKDPDTLYVLNSGAWKSTDAGRSFTRMHTPHGDNHDIWIDPQNPKRLIEGNDGGGTISFNGGETWSTIYNQPTAQLYHVITDDQFPYRVYGPQQDNSTISLPSRSDYGSIAQDEWYAVGGGESGYIAVRPDNPNIVYGHTMASPMTRYDHRTRQSRDVTVWPEYHTGWGARDLKYRFGWTFPIVLSPHDPDVVYVSGNHIFRSTNEGQSWEPISPDLSRQDQSKLAPTVRYGEEETGEYWGPVSRENISVEYYAMVFTLAESPVERGLLWAGTDDGLIHISRDAGKNWEEVTPEGIPEWALMSLIEPSPHDGATAYVAATRYKLDDFRPYLYKTHDYGKTWTKITEGIPEHHYTRVVREDPSRRGLLYAGTEFGLFVSLDDGEHWQSLRLNLPVVPIHDLVVKEKDLVVATHGRSFWILDDLTPLHQLSDEVLQTSAHLFAPRATVRFDDRKGRTFRPVQSSPSASGQNPPNGVVVHYYLKSKPPGPLKLSLLDDEGQLIREHSSDDEMEEGPRRFFAPPPVKPPTAEAGANRFVWNLRYPDARGVPGYNMVRLIGPRAVPGTYEVRLSVDGQTESQRFEVVKDPRLTTTQAELEEQFELLIAIRDKISESHDAVNEIRHTRDELSKLVEASLERAENRESALRTAEAAEAIDDKLWRIEDELIQFRAKGGQDLWNYPIMLNNKLASLARFVGRSDTRPTDQQHEVFRVLAKGVDEQAEKLRAVIKDDWCFRHQVWLRR